MNRCRAGDNSLRPDMLVFVVLMKSCARSNTGSKAEKRKVLQLALHAMETLEKGEFCPPSDVAYATAMSAINRLAGTTGQRDELLGSIFSRCAERGLVSSQVLMEMNHGGSLRLFLQLTGGKNQLEPEWSRNVLPKNRPNQA